MNGWVDVVLSMLVVNIYNPKAAEQASASRDIWRIEVLALCAMLDSGE